MLKVMGKNDKQDLIIEAALAVFREKGYANTRMADIAKRAGVSYGLVYHYFGSKDVLFDVIVDTWWNSAHAMLDAQKDPGIDFEQKLINIIRFFLDTYANNPDLITIFVTEVSRSSVYHTPKGLANFRKTFKHFEDIMGDGQKSGFLRKDIGTHYLTYIFLGAIEAFISVMVLGNEPMSAERERRAINSIIQVFLYGARVKV